MTDQDEELCTAFRGWITTLPHQEVVRRYRALSKGERVSLRDHGWEKSTAALNSRDPYNDRFEILARWFDVFADGDVADPLLSSADLFRERAHDLRHADETRKEHEAAAKRNQISERRAKALALASSCWADDPRDVRLRRIEEILPQLDQLAGQAAAEGNLPEKSAIAEDIVGLWRLRDALKQRS